MLRVLITLVAALAVGAVVASGAHHTEDGEQVRVLSALPIHEKLDGNATTATFVEVTIEPGQTGVPHRHPGPGLGYILEGEYELAINDQPSRVLKTGETFYEPAGCLHRVSRNPGKVKTRLIAVVLHPRETEEISVPETNEQ